MNKEQLIQTAQAMVAPGKGILAIDESSPTNKKRFDALGVEVTEENRRLYRQLLVTAPGINEAVSGYILFDETIRQKTDDGTLFTDVLKAAGILPGIKVDGGAKPLALHEKEKVTEGLDGLRDRLQEYVQLGATFTKWRAVYTIADGLPSEACYKANAHALARYAALAQEAGLVPMVEPEILYDGNHSIETCAEVSGRALDTLFAELTEQGVFLEGVILKTSMVLAGNQVADQSTPEEVAKATLEVFKKHVPAEVQGIVFLSGGQSPEQSTMNLNAMHQSGETFPWPISFSYGRGIQNPALEIWAKDPSKVTEAQAALVHRAKANSLAAKGEYTAAFEEGVE
jgi:fructose-bisphosphate aldolase class I